MTSPWQVLAALPLLLPAIAWGQAPGAKPSSDIQLAVSMPLGAGYYRPGKYIPVRIRVNIKQSGRFWCGLASQDPTQPVPGEISGLGSMRTSVQVGQGEMDAIVPWLVLDQRAKRPRLFVENHPQEAFGPDLLPLEEGRRLIAMTFEDDALAKRLGARPDDVIRLDFESFIKSHPVAWEILHAVVLSPSEGQRLTSAHLSGLLACGVKVVVKGPRPPLPHWPWNRAGLDLYPWPTSASTWEIEYHPAGPTSAGYHEAAYAPVQNWELGWPWAFRRRILLLALGACVPIIALLLWRPPHVWLWLIAVAAIVGPVMGRWWSMHLLHQQASGEVRVLSDGMTQVDGWAYQQSTRQTTATLRWNQICRPVIATPSSLDAMWITLNCDESGQPAEFHLSLPPRKKLAFLSRLVGPRSPQIHPTLPVTTPMMHLANPLYLDDPDARLAGQIFTASTAAPAYGYIETEQWQAVVIDRRKNK